MYKIRRDGLTRLVAVDRVGTLNVERHHLTSPEQLELLPNVAAGLCIMRNMGLAVVVITNQSAVDRGYVDLLTLERIHSRLRYLLSKSGAILDVIYICPHLPQKRCNCRKPGTALLRQAARDFGADPKRAFVIGDQRLTSRWGFEQAQRPFW